jgi:peptide chain release factor 1
VEDKIKKLLERYHYLESELGKPDAFLDQKLYREMTQEYSYLSQLKEAYDYFQKVSQELISNQSLLLGEKDPEMIKIIEEEISSLHKQKELTQKRLERILVPPDPRDSRNIVLEIRAGTGGEEAALFVADCARMYEGYAAKKGWNCELLSASASDIGGYKEYCMGISGLNVFRLMQHEAGTHRVQRVPETEAQGRVHTSAVTVAVLMEPEEQEIIIDEKDLKIDTYRSSGAGGQHVNTTDSAVRITHIPTGTVVACQEERSQHKNKAKAMRILSAKIAEEIWKKQEESLSKTRSMQVGTGDRSERIRTYNFPQNRVTDHRINLTLYNLNLVMEGDLDEITEALVAYFYQQKLSL